MSYFVNGQCFLDGLTITSQAQVDNFATDYPDCTWIQGGLQIDSANSLKGLNQLVSIGNISINGNSGLKNLDGLENITHLDYLDISESDLESTKGLTNLQYIDDIHIFGNDNLKEVVGFDNLYNCVSIYIESNPILEIISSFSKLDTIYEFSIKDNLELKSFSFDGRAFMISTLDFWGNPKLETIQMNRVNRVEFLTVVESSSLNILEMKGLQTAEYIELFLLDELTNLDGFSNLKNVNSLSFNRIKGLNNLQGLENILNVFSLEISGNPNLTSLDGLNKYLKVSDHVGIYDNVKLIECEILCFLATSSINIFDTWGNGANCNDIIPGNCRNVLKGRIFYDENRNGIFDDSELPMENFAVKIQIDNEYVLSNEVGNYFIQFYESVGKYSFGLDNYSTFELTTENDSYTVTYDELKDSLDYDFGLIHDGNYHDITSNISSYAPRCFEEVEFKLKLTNLGSYVENGEVIIRYDAYNTFTGKANPTPTRIDTSKHLLYYDYQDFKPFEIKEFKYTLKMPGVEAIDQYISNSGVIYNYVDGDTSLISHCNLREVIQCSFDPNDKTAYPPGVQEENYTLKGDTLRYRIRFQNTGNAEAYDITVRDTLSEHFDMSTFKVLASSHPVQTSISRSTTREIAFVFEDIHLPDSTSNPEGSQGYVMYEIVPKKGLPENTLIENTAFIYFDYNPAIVTNTAFNTMVTTIPVDEDPEDEDPEIEEPIAEKTIITPNPTNTLFKLSLESDLNLEVVLTDITGKIAKKMKYEKDKSYSITEILAGLYFVNVVNLDSDEVIFMEKLVILK